jgi:histidinol-phosphate aminotransferase
MRAAITTKTKLVFIANPNNPTGTRVTNDELNAFIKSLPEHVICVLDEAYIEFLDDPPPSVEWAVGSWERHSCRDRSGQESPSHNPKVVVLRTFSKIVGLAGLRIGYGIAQKECIALFQRVRQPFNVNSVAQAGALAALSDTGHIRTTKAMTRRGRAFFEKEFKRLRLEFVPSCTNFVLVNVGNGDKIFSALQRRGVIVRPMRAYKMPAWIRVTVGLPEQNRKFIRELKECLSA